MSATITFDQAIIQLVEMFPKIDVDVIKMILLENSI